MASLEEDFRSFATTPTGVVDGAMLVSRIVHPDTSDAWCRSQLRALSREVGEARNAASVLAMLRAAGFQGAEQYYDPDNSALELVLRRKRGIPISLAAVTIGVCELLGLEARGINFPGHFLVTIEGELVDPFLLQLVDDRERDERILASGVPAALALREATAADMVLRMLNNLRGLASSRGDHAQALEFIDFQLQLSQDQFPLLMARAESWFALGAGTQAARELERALAVAPDATMAARITTRLRELAARKRTLH